MQTSFKQKFVFHMLVFPTLAACTALVYFFIMQRKKRFPQVRTRYTNESIKTRIYAFASLLAFGLYAGLSTRIFRLFKCKEIQGKIYLAADYHVQCYEGTWWNYGAAAIFCIFIYVIGIPMAQFSLLFLNRKHLHETRALDNKAHRIVKKQFGSIYENFTEECFYFELVDMTRRLVLTGGLILVGEHSVTQMLLGILTALLWFSLVALKFPYKAYWDNVLQLTLSFGLLLALVSGLALKLYLLEKMYTNGGPIPETELGNGFEQKLFDGLLVATTAMCILSGVFALVITLPGCKEIFILVVDKAKTRHNRREIIMWGKSLDVYLKWLTVDQVKNILNAAEESFKQRVTETIKEQNMDDRANILKTNSSKEKTQVYPLGVLARIHKKKPSIADFVAAKKEIDLHHKRRRKMQMLLPHSLRKAKFDHWGRKNKRKTASFSSISKGLHGLVRVNFRRKEVARIDAAHEQASTLLKKKKQADESFIKHRKQQLRDRVNNVRRASVTGGKK
jgi:hypothetical protein